MGWSSNVLKMQIESKLYERQINSRKVNNFTATLPVPQSDLANYLLKDPYIFDLGRSQRTCGRKGHRGTTGEARHPLSFGNGQRIRLCRKTEAFPDWRQRFLCRLNPV